MTPTAPAASLVRSTLGSLSEGAAEQSEAEGVYPVENVGVLRYTNDTLSVSPFGLPALPEGEPRRLRRSGRLPVDPYSGLHKTVL